MNAEQSNRLAIAFARETARSATSRLCTTCVEVLEVTGAGITVMGGDQAGPICVSDSGVAALSLQDDAPAGSLGEGLDEIVHYRAEIYQASGVVAIQLAISAADALMRIRAHAFATDAAVADVAAEIVARRLRLPDDHGQPTDRQQPETEV